MSNTPLDPFAGIKNSQTSGATQELPAVFQEMIDKEASQAANIAAGMPANTVYLYNPTQAMQYLGAPYDVYGFKKNTRINENGVHYYIDYDGYTFPRNSLPPSPKNNVTSSAAPPSSPGSKTAGAVGSSPAGKSSSKGKANSTTQNMMQQYVAQRALQERLMAIKRQEAQSAYERNMKSLGDAYRQRSDLLQGNYASTLGEMQRGYDEASGRVNANADGALQQSYIIMMQTQKGLPEMLSVQGLGGRFGRICSGGIEDKLWQCTRRCGT